MNNEQIIRKVLYPNTFKERTKYELQRADVALEKARIDERKQMPPIGINYKGITKEEHEEIKKDIAKDIFKELERMELQSPLINGNRPVYTYPKSLFKKLKAKYKVG